MDPEDLRPHYGVGADGVEWLSPDAEADVAIHLLNADGSEAEISGNGTRCVAAWLTEQSGKRGLKIRTGAGVKTCSLITDSDKSFEFRTAMGRPQWAESYRCDLRIGKSRESPSHG